MLLSLIAAGPHQQTLSVVHAANYEGMSIGLTPLSDLGTGGYKGEDGGLYGEGPNQPPATHLAGAELRAGLIVPRDATSRRWFLADSQATSAPSPTDDPPATAARPPRPTRPAATPGVDSLRSFRVRETPSGDRMWISTLDPQAQARFDQLLGRGRVMYVCGWMQVEPTAEWGWEYDPGVNQLRILRDLPEDGLWKTIRQFQSGPITVPDIAACVQIEAVTEAVDGPPPGSELTAEPPTAEPVGTATATTVPAEPTPTEMGQPDAAERLYLPLLLLRDDGRLSEEERQRARLTAVAATRVARETPQATRVPPLPTSPNPEPTLGPAPLPSETALPTVPAPLVGDPLPLGEVSSRDEGCRDFASELPDTRCIMLEVTCPSASRILLSIAISEPHGDGPERGTILLGTGGGGTGWYENFGPTAIRAMTDLRESGYRIVQRSWGRAWESGEAGMAANACRYATLVAWVDAEFRATEPESALCVSGNSGGSAEIGYALARYGSEAYIDFAVPSGGPPMSRLDKHCAGGFDARWQRECAAMKPGESACDIWACEFSESNRRIIDSAYPGTPCVDRQLEVLMADSILSPDADLDYPHTPVHVVIGDEDCGSAPSQGLLYYQAIESAKALIWAADTPHSTPRGEAGAAAIRDALLENCVRRR